MLLIFNFLISLIFVVLETLSLLRNRWKLLLPDLFNIFCFWNWKKSKQRVYYIVALGIENFFSLHALCVTWSMLMCWWHWLKNLLLCVPAGNIKLLISKYLIWQYVVLGPFLFCILHFRMTEYLFWICTFHIASLLYSPSCRHDLFCDLGIVLLRHSHGNLSGLPKSKSWWSAISFGNLSTLLSLCLLL